MKKDKKVLLILLTIVIFTSSCDTVNRLYSPRFYSVKHNKKQSTEFYTQNSKNENVINNNCEDLDISNNGSQTLINNECSFVASNDNTPILVANHKNLKSTKVDSKFIKSINNKVSLSQPKSLKILENNKTDKISSSDGKSSSVLYKTIGLVLAGTGAILMVTVSILLGLLVAVLGYILFNIGWKKHNPFTK
jgi:hypothetical protein